MPIVNAEKRGKISLHQSMAESIVTFFLTKLSDMLVQDASKFEGAEEQLRFLQDELQWMRLVLEAADANRRKTDKRFNLFITQVRDITFSAEDVIDEFVFRLNRHSQQRLRISNLLFSGTFAGCLCCALKSMILRDLSAHITVINARIEKISSNKSRYGIEHVPSNLGASSSYSNTTAPTAKGRRFPVVEEVDVVGVEDDTATVREMLLSPDLRRTVVSVVGMGGLGKTTLARNVYKCNDIQRHFHCRALVYVSQDYRVDALLLEIMKQAMSRTNSGKIEELEKMDVHDLGSKLRHILSKKKYLIVLDDLWSTEAWDCLHSYFPDSNTGSKILLTTRNREVALYTDPHSSPHELRLLNPKESWVLFGRMVFGAKNSTAACPPDLKKLGRKIVGKCEGLPLAIVVLGGLLSSKERTHNSWQRVLDSVNWHLGRGPKSCWEILSLSYDDLPYYLKSCFLYCGLFPEDCEIQASKLMRMWVAEGFIESRGEEAVLEDIAEDYLEELLHRNMIQVMRKRSNGRVKTLRIHDLLRELSISEAKEARAFYINKREQVSWPNVIRRLAVHDSLPIKMMYQNQEGLKFRSLICFYQDFDQKSWATLQASMKLLTVLDLEEAKGIHTLPKEIGELIHLKFLLLRRSSIRRLPWAIGKLANLQTLDLRGTDVKSMPPTVWELQQLRHFYGNGEISRYHERLGMQVDFLGVGQLVNLQTLSLGWGDWLEDDGLRKLTQLRKLQITTRFGLHGPLGSFSASLQKLTGLQSLLLGDLLSLEKLPEFKPFAKHEDLYKMMLRGRLVSLPAAVGFYPPNLNKLVLHWSKLDDDPMPTLEKLPHLKFLELGKYSYLGKKMSCSPGGFPQLLSLSLHTLNSLEEWDVDEGSLGVLRNLEISRCEKMKRLPNALLRLQNLLELKIAVASAELRDHVKQMEGEDWVKKPSIVIQYLKPRR